jgi:predicted transcriptional regulator of viral defense system
MNEVKSPDKDLFEIAESQQGLFTAKQAEDVGFIRSNHAYHVKVGNWIREMRGIYRLAFFPFESQQQLVIHALWSKNRLGEVQGVFSHETALSYHDLSDVNPTRIHMSVPTHFRRNSAIPKVLKLHFSDLKEKDIQQARGFLVTNPLKTIQDTIDAQSVSPEFIVQSISQGIERGLFSKKEIKYLIETTEISKDMSALIKRHLRDVA